MDTRELWISPVKKYPDRNQQRAAAANASYHRRYHDLEMAWSRLLADFVTVHHQRLCGRQHILRGSGAYWMAMGL